MQIKIELDEQCREPPNAKQLHQHKETHVDCKGRYDYKFVLGGHSEAIFSEETSAHIIRWQLESKTSHGKKWR